MVTERFDSRTLANMEVALELACKTLATGAEEHRIRRHIAGKILKCADGGNKTLGGLTKAGLAAATELCAASALRRRPRPRPERMSKRATNSETNVR